MKTYHIIVHTFILLAWLDFLLHVCVELQSVGFSISRQQSGKKAQGTSRFPEQRRQQHNSSEAKESRGADPDTEH